MIKRILAVAVSAGLLAWLLADGGESEGDFSLEGWMRDMRAAVDHLVSEADPSGV